MTQVVNIHHEKYDVYIGRAGKGEDGYFGNPFHHGGRSQNISMYKTYFYKRLAKDPEFEKRIHELKDKKLGCFCKPRQCHGDIIVEYLNREELLDQITQQDLTNGLFKNIDPVQQHKQDNGRTDRKPGHDSDSGFPLGRTSA